MAMGPLRPVTLSGSESKSSSAALLLRLTLTTSEPNDPASLSAAHTSICPSTNLNCVMLPPTNTHDDELEVAAEPDALEVEGCATANAHG